MAFLFISNLVPLGISSLIYSSHFQFLTSTLVGGALLLPLLLSFFPDTFTNVVLRKFLYPSSVSVPFLPGFSVPLKYLLKLCELDQLNVSKYGRVLNMYNPLLPWFRGGGIVIQ